NQTNATTSLPAVALLHNFSSTGYTFSGSPLTSTGVSGTLPGPVVLPNDQGGANFFTQGVDAFGLLFQFSVTLSGDAIGGPAPDGSNFFVFLLDPSFNQIVSPLTLEGEVLGVTVTPGGNTVAYGSTFGGGSAQVALAPEPAAGLLLLSGAAGLL